MGLLSGRATFLRLKAKPPRTFDDDHMEKLCANAFGAQRIASADGVQTGWGGGAHVLDTDFDTGKNAANDALAFDFLVETNKLPGDKLKAYYQVEIKALASQNPSGLPSAKQKREAKEAARDRLEEEAKDGRFKKRKAIPILWDRPLGELLYGATSIASLDRMTSLFRTTFDVEPTAMTAGTLALSLAEPDQRTRSVDDAVPSRFVDGGPEEFSWIADESSRDWLGNEFLVWLWFQSDGASDTIKLRDGTEATFMFARTLDLECPRGQTGRETISSDGPTRLPEARRALQSGKLPRKAGLTLVRRDQQYELTLHAETLGIAGVKFPPAEEESPQGKATERMAAVRDLVESVDLLYDAFLRVRLSGDWMTDLSRIQKWLARDR